MNKRLSYYLENPHYNPRYAMIDAEEDLGTFILEILVKEKGFKEKKAFEIEEIIENNFWEGYFNNSLCLSKVNDNFIRNFVNVELQNMKGVN